MMLRRLVHPSLVLLLLLLGSCTGTEPVQTGDFTAEDVELDVPAGAIAYVPTLDGPLRILSATPAGPLTTSPPELALAVTFSRPMVPLGEAPVPEAGVLTLEPAVPGTFRWEGTQTLVFEPSAPLPPATRYRARLAAGLTSVDGETLAEPYPWTFETPRPDLVASDPVRGEPFAPPQAPIYLYFNQRVDAGAAEDYLQLYRRTDNSEAREPITVRQDGDSTLVLQPRARLRPGTTYEVRVQPGIPSVDGSLPMDTYTEVTFSTYGAPDLVDITQDKPWWAEHQAGIDPARGVTLVFSTPVRFGDVRRALTVVPAVTWPAGIEAQDDRESTHHTLPAVWAPETRYAVSVVALTDRFGQTLARDDASFTTHALQPSLEVATGLMVVEAEHQAFVPFRATNINTMQLGMRRMRADEIVPLLPVYDWEHYYGETLSARAESLQVIEPARRVALNVPRNVPTTAPLRLDSLLNGGTGVVAFRAMAPQVPGQAQREWRGLAQVTRLGLTAKFSAHQVVVLVTDLETAAPQAGVTVTLRDATNRARWRGTTDDRGRATAPGWAALGLRKANTWESPVLFAFAEKGGDFAFTSSVYRDGLEPYRFDVDYQWAPEPQTIAGSVFTDRGLYRAGEKAFVKAILRRRTDADWQAVTDSVRVLVVSPRDEVVLDRRFKPSALGTFDFDWTPPESATQGAYLVRVVSPADTNAVRRSVWEDGDMARGTFRVDAFRTATFEVTARPAARSYVAGDFFEGTLGGRYLFGADMAGQPANYALVRTYGSFAPPGYDAYRFGTYDGAQDLYRTLAQADTVLGPGGTVTVRSAVPGNDAGAPARLAWSGEVEDPAYQRLSDRTEVTLHPGLFYVGLKPRTTFIDLSQDDALPVDVITVDPGGVPVSGKAVEVELLRRQWNSVREVGADGRLRWRSEQSDEVLGRSRVTTAPGRAKRLYLPVKAGGSYVVRATAHDVRGNTIRTEAYFYATGTGYVAWERRDDDRIDLIPEKTAYRPGETARFMVQSPYEEATALITVEREGVLSSRVETLRGSAPQIEVPLTEAHLPNVFVSVVLLSARSAEPGPGSDTGAPGFKIGYAGIRVDPGVRHLQVAVEPGQEAYRPGDEVTVELQLRDADGRGVQGEIAFSAADAGVLNLIDYRLPDPFDAFYGPRALGVTTSESRAHLVDQRNFGQKAEDVIGGGGDAGSLLRKDFRPLAHWAPAVRTDSRGRARVTFRLPESLTTFRLMATAVTANHRFGAGSTDVVVTQPLVLQAALPRFARPGDAFEAGVLVTNTTGAGGEAVITASAEGLVVDGPARQTVRLADGETRAVRFRWRAPRSGPARLTFEARLGGEQDAFVTAFPVNVPLVKETSATFASTDDTAREAVRLPADRVPGLGLFEVQLSSTALIGFDGAARYLFEYPYGCLEQRTSRVRPLLAAADLLDAFDLEVPGGNRQAAVQAWLDGLREYWVGDGFALWQGDRNSYPYLTAYVVAALAEARAAGYDAPDGLTKQAVDALEAQVRRPSDRPAYYPPGVWRDTRAFMLYALARHGRVLEGEIDALASRREALSFEGQAILLRTIALARRPALERYRRPMLDALMGQLRVGGTTAYIRMPQDDSYRWIFASDVRATAYGLTALLEAAAEPTPDLRQLAQRMVRYLIEARRHGAWASTQENMAVVEALQAYHEAFESEAPALTAEVRLAGRELLQASFDGRSLKVAEATRTPDELQAGTEALPLAITKRGTGPLYYTLRLQTYSTTPRPAVANGLRVERRLQRLNDRGQPVGQSFVMDGGRLNVQAGELMRVTLRVLADTDRHYAVVDDALPAGLEVLNAAFATTNQDVLDQADAGQGNWWGSFNHTEIRDDRVLLFADMLRRGEHTYTYVARATTPGTFVYPPTQAELMYQPEIHGRTAGGTLVVAEAASL